MKPPNLSRLIAARDDNDQHAAFMAMHSDRFEAYRTRHEDGTAPRAVSAYQLFQTPRPLAARMAELADLSPGLRVLEPSAGLGRLLDEIQQHKPSDITACEVSPDLCRELYNLNAPNVRILQRDFLETTGTNYGLAFDRIVMNPPFHMRADIRHTRHALTFLRPGGVLVGLCMATHHRAAALQPLADHWEEIPAGAFRKEGTGVATYLFRIRKS